MTGAESGDERRATRPKHKTSTHVVRARVGEDGRDPGPWSGVESTPIDPYALLSPMQRRFVDGVASGENPTRVMRTLKPRLRRPDCSAGKWMRQPRVRAALEDRTKLGGTSWLREAYQLGLQLASMLDYLERIESRLVKLERAIAASNAVAGQKP